MDKVNIQIKKVGLIELYPNDHIDRTLLIYGEYENNLIELMEKILSKGDSFLDIGANIGYFTLIASNIVEKEGTVYSFEASNDTFKKLDRNVSLNKQKNVKLLNYAVSNKEETLTFNIQKGGNSGMSSLRKLDGYETEQIKVIAKPIDYFLNEIKPIKLIKMDKVFVICTIE